MLRNFTGRRKDMEQKNGMGIASLVCGIASLLTGWVGYFVAIVCGILAIVFSSKSKTEVGPNSYATAGLITGIIGLVYSLPVTICYLACGAALCTAGL